MVPTPAFEARVGILTHVMPSGFTFPPLSYLERRRLQEPGRVERVFSGLASSIGFRVQHQLGYFGRTVHPNRKLAGDAAADVHDGGADSKRRRKSIPRRDGWEPRIGPISGMRIWPPVQMARQ